MKIDRDSTSEQVLTLLDAIESDEEDKTDHLMNDFDTKFIVEEKIAEEENENDNNDAGDLLVPDDNVQIASAEMGKIRRKKLRKGKESKKKFHIYLEEKSERT